MSKKSLCLSCGKSLKNEKGLSFCEVCLTDSDKTFELRLQAWIKYYKKVFGGIKTK